MACEYFNDPKVLMDLLGMERMIRRAEDVATSPNPDAVAKWHKAEVDSAMRTINDQLRSKIRPEFDRLYADTPSLFELLTIEEFAAKMGVSVADVMNDGAMQPPKNEP